MLRERPFLGPSREGHARVLVRQDLDDDLREGGAVARGRNPRGQRRPFREMTDIGSDRGHAGYGGLDRHERVRLVPGGDD